MYSQNNEEEIILNYFNGHIGTVLDIGANDGKTFSNSRKLTELGWKGIMVEPSILAFLRLSNLYKGNDNVSLHNIAITEKDGNVILHESGPLCSKKLKKKDIALISTIKEEELYRWRKWEGRIFWTRVLVVGRTFESFYNSLDEEFKEIDFITIDAEGMDYEILSQIDLEKLKTKLVCVEYIKNSDKFLSYLLEHGYRHIATTKENVICGI